MNWINSLLISGLVISGTNGTSHDSWESHLGKDELTVGKSIHSFQHSPSKKPAKHSKPTPPPIKPTYVCTEINGELITIYDPDGTTNGTYIANACPTDPHTVINLTPLAEHAFHTMNLTPTGINLSPPNKGAIYNLPLITYTSNTPITTTTTLLTTTVLIKATPTTYTWDWGDGTPPLTTTNPGGPYPNFDTSHAYQQLGNFTITLTTTWKGTYSTTNGNTWIPIPGTATTTQTTNPITVVEKRPVLIN